MLNRIMSERTFTTDLTGNLHADVDEEEEEYGNRTDYR